MRIALVSFSFALLACASRPDGRIRANPNTPGAVVTGTGTGDPSARAANPSRIAAVSDAGAVSRDPAAGRLGGRNPAVTEPNRSERPGTINDPGPTRPAGTL